MTKLALSSQQQQQARNAAVNAAKLGLHNAAALHYTQGASRWQGIDNHLDASKGQFPNYADCSSFATWAIWNGLYLLFGMEDVVNASNWQAGYTGTMLANGKTVAKASDLLPGDCVIYGAPGSTGEHTAIVWQSGSTPRVISNGSEGGPYDEPWNYRSDVQSLRRYIDGDAHEASGGSSPTPIPEPPEDTVALFAVLKQDGRIEVFVQKSNGQVMHTWQTAKDGGWAGAEKGKNAAWYDLGNPGK